jgi:opacity protein-like surface antigen
LRLDYRYTDYGSETQTFLTGGTVQNLDAVKADLKSSAHAANVGIAYRF